MKKLLLYFISIFSTISVFGQLDTTVRTVESVRVSQQQLRMSTVDSMSIGSTEINALPRFMGLADPLKALKFLPGFGNGGDGNAGTYFRGLGVGNNGYYLNDVEIHYPYHLFGLFPVFNAEMVKAVTVYQTSAPGHYMGKASTYIAVQSNWQIKDTSSVNADLSLFHAGIGFRKEIAGRWLIAFQGRKTFMNQTLWPVLAKFDKDQNETSYDLYDLNLNLKRQFNRHSLQLTLYKGADKALLLLADHQANNVINWGNTALGVTHQFSFANGSMLKTSLSNSSYAAGFGLGLFDNNLAFQHRLHSLQANSTWSKPIRTARLDLGYVWDVQSLNTLHKSTLQMEPDYIADASLQRHKVFAGLNKLFGTKWEAHLRLGLTHYRNLQDSFTYQLIEPQARVSHTWTERSSIYGSYGAYAQPIQHVPLTNISMPIDLWVPAGRAVKPMYVHQFLLGFKYAKQNRMEFSLDVYRRHMDNSVEFNGNIVELSADRDIYKTVYKGIGLSYGMDVFIKYFYGRYRLLTNYSYARTFRKAELINNQDWYPFVYDRPHNLNLAFFLDLAPQWTLSTSFTLNSGATYTPSVGRYFLNNMLLSEMGSKNSARTDLYHRLDLGITYIFPQTTRLRQELVLGIINVYNRRNPLYKYETFQRSYYEKYNKYKLIHKDAGVLPVLPSITYLLKL